MKQTSKKIAVGLLTTTIVASQVFPTSLSLFPEQAKGIDAHATYVYIAPAATVQDMGSYLRVTYTIDILSAGGSVDIQVFRPWNPSSPTTSGGQLLDEFPNAAYPTAKGTYSIDIQKRVAAEAGDIVRVVYNSKAGTELGIAATPGFAKGYLSNATTNLINDAKSKVNALFTDSTKSAIKSTTNQAAIDAAQAAIDKLPSGTDKTNLQNDLNKAKDLLAAKIATENAAKNAVNALFTDASKTGIKPVTDQAAIDAAQALVNKVTDPTVKAALQADVNKAQSLLDAKNATAAEQAKQDAAKKAVDELFNNNTPASNAIKPVTDQAAIDAAQDLVNKVTDPTAKAALQADVDKAQDLLDARNQADRDQKAIASYLVNQLFQNNTPTSDAIKPTTDQASIDAAQAEINKIVDPTVKAELQKNLDRAQELLDQRNAAANQAKQDAAKKAVDELFNNNTPSSNAIKPTTDQAAIDAAQDLVNKVTDPATKAALQADVDKAQSLLDAKKAAAAAEQAKQDAAKKAVDELFNNNTPSSNAIKPTTDQAAIDAAQALVNKVTDPAAKAALQADVDKAQSLLDAKNAAAEQAKQDAAKKAVDELFNNNTPSSNAIKPTTDQAAIDAAKALVNKVTDPATKAALQANVDKAQNLLDAKNAALTAPKLNPYAITEDYITGKVDANTATVELYINGVRSKVSTPTNGDFKLYAKGFGLQIGDTFEVRPVDATGKKGPATTGTVLAKSPSATYGLTANDAGMNAKNITGVAGNGFTTVRLAIDGVIVKVGQINADGTYSIATDNKIKVGSKVEVVGYTDKTEMARTAVKIVNDEKPVLEALTVDDETLKGSVTAGSATIIRISINGELSKTATIEADGTFQSSIGKQAVGTVVTVEVKDSNGYNSFRTESVTVTGSAVAKLAAPTLEKMDGDYIVGTAPKGTESITIYEDGAAVRTQNISTMTANPDGSFTFKAYVAAGAKSVQVQAKNSDKRMNSNLSTAFTK
ncbi:hypothetical protein HB848_07570 [Listeria rocourtiae]|uniref:toxin Cry1Ac domain D-VI-related protein n=1 Tax=Listeria rocourtiae TaxID=647910 RepID=UPI00162A292F|nr:toxin Cry1Ac domain D-VI-related protein [Listeria rocourtiae]MBC1435198.1 hypothetical protein [Listeria rocourtiae]